MHLTMGLPREQQVVGQSDGMLLRGMCPRGMLCTQYTVRWFSQGNFYVLRFPLKPLLILSSIILSSSHRQLEFVQFKGHNSCSNLKLIKISQKCHYQVFLFQLVCTKNFTSNGHTNVLSKIFCDVLYNINYNNVLYTKYQHQALVGDYLFINFIFIK